MSPEWVRGFDRTVIAELRAAAQVVAWQERLYVAEPYDGWHRRAACLGLTELMYPKVRPGRPRSDGKLPRDEDVRVAIAVCESCPVRLACLGDARDFEVDRRASEVHGVRGGLTVAHRLHAYRRLCPRPTVEHQPCGTEAAYMRHRYHEEPPCRSCLEAHAARTAEKYQRAGRRNHHARSA